nr:transporter substrate-binding domain-containing protein [uncultured Pseudomonas sp.]
MARFRHIGGLLVLMCALSGPLAAQEEPLNVYVGQGQMPFADGVVKGSGLFGELMRELCTRTAQQCVFRSVPWRRVLSEAEGDPHGIVLNLGRTPERENGFVWLLDVLPTPYVLVSLDRTFDNLNDALRAGPVAVMAGTPRADELKRIQSGDQRVVEVTDPLQAAELLRSGRVVAWYEIDLRAFYLWREMNAQAPLLAGKPLSSTRSHIAGSLKLEGAEALSQKMTAAFEDMHRDGSWQRILVSYLGLERSRALLSGGW